MRFELSCKLFGIWWGVWQRDMQDNQIAIAYLRLAFRRKSVYWKLVWDDDAAPQFYRLVYHTERNGQRTGWALQGPLVKLY